MLNAEIICIGKANQRFIKDGCDEYIKRLSPYVSLKISELPEGRLRDESDSATLKAMAEEGAAILKKLEKKRTFVVALCVEGEQKSSEQFAGLIESACMDPGDMTLIIGGSHGIAKEVKDRADLRLSMSRMTMPHQLARLVLCEQMYRAAMINSGRTYHK